MSAAAHEERRVSAIMPDPSGLEAVQDDALCGKENFKRCQYLIVQVLQVWQSVQFEFSVVRRALWIGLEQRFSAAKNGASGGFSR